MFKAISSILLAALLICFPSYAHTAEVKSEGNHPYKAVRPTPEIYRGANADLSDLRIRDSQGKDIPYFIHSGGQSSSEESESYKMELQNAYMQDDILYNVGGEKKDEIFFTTPLKYTHYRVKLSNNLEKISFGLVTLKYSMTDTQEYYFRETLKPQFTVEEKEKDTTIPLGERYLSEEDFTLRISNYDDVPIKIKDITVSYFADEVVFAAGENKSVTLFFGDAAAVSPVYDIETYKNEILRRALGGNMI